MEEDRFCTRCGSELPEGASFCAECGSPVGGDGSPSQSYGSPYSAPYVDRTRAGKGPGFAFIILLYGIVAIVFGLMDAVSYFGMTEASYNELIDYMSEIMGMDASGFLPVWTDGTGTLMGLSMVFLIVSGVLAIVCYVFCRKAESWKLAVLTCAASAVACLGISCFSLYVYLSIPLFVIGVLVTALLYSQRNTFKA